MNTAERALGYLYRQLKKARIDLGHAEMKGAPAEIKNLESKIEILEWLTGVTVKEIK